jgi:glycosyltransferase involved in cell wall biosynthesis
MSGSVGIVIPAYRPDVEQLAAYVEDLRAAVAPDAVLVEVDAPSAETEAALRDLPVAVHVAAERRGKGAAITAGFERLDADVLAFADADGSTPADSIADVIAAITDGGADLAVGSRRHPGAEIGSHQTYARRWLGDGFAWLARRLLAVDLHDYQCGAKAVRRDTWEQVRAHLYEPGFAWDVEFVAMAGALGADVAEVPVRWEDQPGSTVSPASTALELFRALLAVRHRAKLLADHPLHSVIAARRDRPAALVDQLPEAGDE